MFRQAMLGHLSSRMLPLVAAVALQKKERKETGLYHWRREKHPYYNLTVKILRARNIKGTDLFSKADCYVELRLPTASPITYRTQVIDNSSDPEWNETFQFRINSAVKNTLELTLFDEDVLVSDELTSVVFDVTGIRPGRPVKNTFKLKEDKEELDVEFLLQKSSDTPTEVLTNGVLVAHPCLCLQGVINKDEKLKLSEHGNNQFKLSLPGSYEKQLSIPCKPDSDQNCGVPFVFHVGKDMCSEVTVEVEQTITVLQDGVSPDFEKHSTILGSGTAPFHSLPLEKHTEMAVPLGKEQSVDLHVKAEQMTALDLKDKEHIEEVVKLWNRCQAEMEEKSPKNQIQADNFIKNRIFENDLSKRNLDVRLGFDLCQEERQFLGKRKKIVSQALSKALQLREDLSKDEVPVVAILGSGGGMRALTSFYGSLFGLQQLNLLDTVIYLSGISGSTWCLSTLYQDPEWSRRDLRDHISNAQDKMSSSKVGAFSSERLKYYFQELNAMENEGRKASFTDLWGLIIEYFLLQKEVKYISEVSSRKEEKLEDHTSHRDKKQAKKLIVQEDPSKLSDQQEAVKEAQNPYPIYAAVNVRPNISGEDFAEWCEFTPYEVGFRKYGAFIRTEDFDSEFFMGRLIKKHPEPRICYLLGMWGSAFAASLDDVFLKVVGSGLSFLESLGDVVKVIDDNKRFHFRDPMRLKTRLVIPGGPLLQTFQDFFKSRVTAGETFNFMQGLFLHRDYINLNKFVVWKGTHLDAFPNQLTPMEESLYLVDGGFSINSAFPVVLQPERDVDVILSFNYSWEAPFEVLQLTQKYCKEREIPFPEIILNKEDEDSPKECYMFIDAENSRAPIVLHFPLVNDTFYKYKAPGKERESEEEIAFGDFAVEGKDSPYRTLNFTFEPHDFNRLVELNCYNVLNNKDAILDALNLALNRRKLKNDNRR